MVPPNNLGPDLTGKPVHETLYRGTIGHIDIANSLHAINLPSFHHRTTNINSTQVNMKSDISSIKGMQVIVWQKPSSYIEGEPMLIVTTSQKHEDVEDQIAEEEPTRPTKVVPISTIILIIRPNLELEMIGFDKGKREATNETEELIKKLVPASREVRQDPNEPVRVPYMINGKMYQLTNDEIQEHLNKEEMIKKKAEEAKLPEMTKY
nr:hypothetical protein [Tanacetum cinerariifolium]